MQVCTTFVLVRKFSPLPPPLFSLKPCYCFGPSRGQKLLPFIPHSFGWFRRHSLAQFCPSTEASKHFPSLLTAELIFFYPPYLQFLHSLPPCLSSYLLRSHHALLRLVFTSQVSAVLQAPSVGGSPSLLFSLFFFLGYFFVPFGAPLDFFFRGFSFLRRLFPRCRGRLLPFRFMPTPLFRPVRVRINSLSHPGFSCLNLFFGPR